MSVWSLTCQQSYLGDIVVANISESFTHKMAAKASWHRNYVTVILCIGLFPLLTALLCRWMPAHLHAAELMWQVTLARVETACETNGVQGFWARVTDRRTSSASIQCAICGWTVLTSSLLIDSPASVPVYVQSGLPSCAGVFRAVAWLQWRTDGATVPQQCQIYTQEYGIRAVHCQTLSQKN